MPGNFGPAVLTLYPNAPTTATQFQAGYSEEGAAIRGLPPTTVPPELRYPGESWQQALVQHAQAAASVLPAVVSPLAVPIVGLASQARNEAQDAAEANAAKARESAQEARRAWETGLQGFGIGVARQLQTFGQELASQRATFGGGSQTYFRTMPGTGTSAAWPEPFPTFRGVTRLTQALRLGRRILTLEDLE